MLKRAYSLKTRYNFSKVFKYGQTFSSKLFLVRYLKINEKYTQNEITKIKFGVVTSNKLTKKKVWHNKIKRCILKNVRLHLNEFTQNYYYVFIPKKAILELLNNNLNMDCQIEEQLQLFLRFIYNDKKNSSL